MRPLSRLVIDLALTCLLSVILVELAESAGNEVSNDITNGPETVELEPTASEKQYIDAINGRCMKSIKLDLDLMEPTFGMLQKDGEVIWLKNSSTDSEILASGYDINKRTIVIIPGYTQHFYSKWIKGARGLILKNGHAERDNYIFMEWRKAASGSYMEVAARARPMGFLLAEFLKRAIKLGQDPKKIHLISHSIGVHLASFAGKNIEPKIGRISAVDPAGPCFGKWVRKDFTDDRLNATDAYQVDVLHYDDALLGITGNVGQIDTFVNGGSRQPGCTGPFATAIRALIVMLFNLRAVYSPAHSRSTDIASTQMGSSMCQRVAYECEDYATFTRGACGECDENNSQCHFMDFEFQYNYRIPEQPLRQSLVPRKFYIVADQNQNFCTLHYQVLLEFEPDEEIIKTSQNYWTVKLQLQFEDGTWKEITMDHRKEANVFSYLLLVNDVKPMSVVDAKLTAYNDWDEPIRLVPGDEYSFQINYLSVNFMSNVDPKVRKQYSSKWCPSGFVIDENRDKKNPKLKFESC